MGTRSTKTANRTRGLNYAVECFITPRDAAKIARVTSKVLRDEGCPCYVLPSNILRYFASEVAAWHAERSGKRVLVMTRVLISRGGKPEDTRRVALVDLCKRRRS